MATVNQQFCFPTRETTLRFGAALGRFCRAGDIIAFAGDLGAGKTTLIQALATGTGVDPDEYVCSPSFSLVHEYRGRLPLYHIDLYRLQGADEVLSLGLDEYFQRDGVALVEWYDRAPEIFPAETLIIRLTSQEAFGRTIHLFTEGSSWPQRISVLLAEEVWLANHHTKNQEQTS